MRSVRHTSLHGGHKAQTAERQRKTAHCAHTPAILQVWLQKARVFVLIVNSVFLSLFVGVSGLVFLVIWISV